MAAQTEELIVALKEADKVAAIQAMIKPDLDKKSDKTDVATELAKKADTVAGKGFSQEDFTTALKQKLSTMEGTHFKGVHKNLLALEFAHPANVAEAGSYAYIKDGANPEKLAMLDDGAWAELASGSAGTPTLTAAQIKSLYESNAETNAFMDSEKAKLAHIDITQDINFDEAILEGDRASSTDLTDPNAGPNVLKRFVDNAGLRHILQAINAPREIYALIGQNPAMKMEIEAGGHSAQMQVVDKEAQHAVASMEWLKATQEFVFTLYDKDTGVAKATFEIKPDGNAYIGGHKVATSKVGAITDVHDIVEAGVYSGVDVTNAPAQGPIIIEAYEDANGDLDLSLKDQTNRRYEGGVPKGGTATWHHVAADHLFGTADPVDTLGNDGDIYFKTS